MSYLPILLFTILAIASAYPISPPEKVNWNHEEQFCMQCHFAMNGRLVVSRDEFISGLFYNEGVNALGHREMEEEGKTQTTVILCRMICSHYALENNNNHVNNDNGLTDPTD